MNVLITEDDPLHRSFLKAAIEHALPECEQVLEAEDGVVAMDIVAHQDVYGVVMDLQMPRASGVDAAKEIWRLHPDMRILFWSNYADEAYVRGVARIVPTGFDRAIRIANRNDVVLVPFDNVLDTKDVMMVNENQWDMGVMSANFIIKQMGKKSGKVLEVRGLPGNSVDRDRHLGFRDVMEKPGNNFEIIEVVGNWDDGHAQKATADALAVHGKFDAIYTQGGSTGTVRALMDAGHKFIPIAGEAENGFRKLVAKHSKDGLVALSAGQSPGLVAIAIKAAISALQGNKMPQLISVPIPVVDHTGLVDGVNYWSDLTDNFFTPNEFPPCDVNISAVEIMAQTKDDQK